MRGFIKEKLILKKKLSILAGILLLLLVPLFASLLHSNSEIENTSYQIRSSVLSTIPIGSNKNKVLDFLDQRGWRDREFLKGPLNPDPHYVSDILVFDKRGVIQSNLYYSFRNENNRIRVDLGAYWELRKSFLFIRRVRVILHLLFWNDRLVQVRVIKS